MTPEEFIRRCVEYFGSWDKQAVQQSVSGFVAAKSKAYLSALWELVRDSRPVGFKAPDMACVMSLHAEACDRLEIGQSSIALEETKVKMIAAPPESLHREITEELIGEWPLTEKAAGDGWLSQRDTHLAIAVVYKKLKAKDDLLKAQEKMARETESESRAAVSGWF